MSRSYKHAGWIREESSKKTGKRFANKRVRRNGDIPSGGHFKKVFEPWNISDWRCEARPRGSSRDAYQDWMK